MSQKQRSAGDESFKEWLAINNEAERHLEAKKKHEEEGSGKMLLERKASAWIIRCGVDQQSRIQHRTRFTRNACIFSFLCDIWFVQGPLVARALIPHRSGSSKGPLCSLRSGTAASVRHWISLSNSTLVMAYVEGVTYNPAGTGLGEGETRRSVCMVALRQIFNNGVSRYFTRVKPQSWQSYLAR